MMVIVAQMGRHNVLVVSQKTLAKLAGCSRATLQRALDVLRESNWIEVRQIGQTGTANAYIVNDRIAWSGARDSMRYSLFSAAVVICADEQPDRENLVSQPPVRRLPVVYAGEQQLPAGAGLPPPSQPSLEGLEPDLPVRRTGAKQTIHMMQERNVHRQRRRDAGCGVDRVTDAVRQSR
jgi:DNA-binding transcriptional MocR family regulator